MKTFFAPVLILFSLMTPFMLSRADLVLESAWFFNEGSGNTISQATLSGDATWNQVTNPNEVFAGSSSVNVSGVGSWGSSSGAPGSTGSFTFNGSMDAVTEGDTQVSGADLTGTAAKTFVAWINPTATDGTILNYSPGGGGPSGGDLRLGIDGNGDLRAEISSGAFVYDNTSLVNDGWKMVAAVYESGSYKFYMGGVGMLTPTDTTGTTINTASYTSGGVNFPNFVFGVNQNGLKPYAGGLDMVAAYTGAASLAELNDIYANGIAIPEPNTLVLLGMALGTILVFRSRR